MVKMSGLRNIFLKEKTAQNWKNAYKVQRYYCFNFVKETQKYIFC